MVNLVYLPKFRDSFVYVQIVSALKKTFSVNSTTWETLWIGFSTAVVALLLVISVSRNLLLGETQTFASMKQQTLKFQSMKLSREHSQLKSFISEFFHLLKFLL